MKERETDSSSNMRRRWTASMPESTATGVSPMAVWEDSEAARGIFREKKTEEGERDLRSEEEEEEWGWRSVVLMLLLNACWLSVTAIKDCAIVFSSWTVLRYLFISRFIIKSRSRGVLSIYGVWRVLTCILEKKLSVFVNYFFLAMCVCEIFVLTCSPLPGKHLVDFSSGLPNPILYTFQATIGFTSLNLRCPCPKGNSNGSTCLIGFQIGIVIVKFRCGL